MKKSLLITLAIALIAGCAKERAVELKPDADQERLSKQSFLGQNGVRSYWFSKVTVTNTSTDGGFAFIGYQSDLKVGFFEFSKDRLSYYSALTPNSPTRPLRITDVVKDEFGKVKNEVTKNDLINAWSVEHSDLRLGESDGRVTNREEENDYLGWDTKKFFTVDWNKANIGEESSFPYAIDSATTRSCWAKKGSELVPGSREIDGDYISFTIAVNYRQLSLCSQSFRRHFRQDFTYTVHYKYSFKRVLEKDLSGYKPYVYSGMTDPLMKKYGYFQTYVESLNKDNRHEINILMNRWHPNRVHTFYFAPDFPEEYKWIFNDKDHGVFAKTNALFAKNGVKARFEILDNDGSKQFGDLRYSFIKMIKDIDPGSPLGYGPSDANPFTGELISANTMIWSGSLKFYVQIIQDHLDRKLDKGGKYDSTVFAELRKTLEESPAQWTSTAALLSPETTSGKAFREILPQRTFGYPGWARFSFGTKETAPPLMKMRGFDKITSLMNTDADLKNLQTTMDAGHKHITNLQNNFHIRNTTVYKADQSVADARKMLVSGKTPQQVIDTILYNVSIHEFGHNLNLRHNFYGSVDKMNFAENTVALDRNNQPIPKMNGKEPVLDEEGKPVMLTTTNHTSSVMEYLALKDEFETSHQWGSYDEAALAYAYTYGYNDTPTDLSKSLKKRFLYCTDEHRVTNALCNTWDTGTTPSEIAMSMIESYDDSYHTVNRRYGRALWNTSGYQSRRFQNMWDMKKFLMLWRSGMAGIDIKRILKTQGHDDETVEEISRDFDLDLKQAVKLSIGFYNAVLQQSSAQRHYRSEYDEWTGELQRVGIISDKIFAMMFLMGDDTFLYNPNRYLNYASFLSYRDHPELAPLIDKVMENTLTVRVDMEPWFIGFGRTMFALNASNFNNMGDRSLMDKIKVACYKPATLKSRFGINPEAFVAKAGEAPAPLDTAMVMISDDVTDQYYARAKGSRLGIVRINGNFFVAGESSNPYAFSIIWNMIQQPVRFDSSLASAKDDLNDTYRLYHYITKSQQFGCE